MQVIDLYMNIEYIKRRFMLLNNLVLLFQHTTVYLHNTSSIYEFLATVDCIGAGATCYLNLKHFYIQRKDDWD